MTTPGNFGGGSTGPDPDQIFLGITRAPPSAPGRGRGRAQGPVRQNPNPQATEHEAAAPQRAALAVKFPIPAKHRRFVSVWVALSLLNFKAPHLIPGRSSPAGSAEGESVGTKLGGSQ
jgi:hypothetical protein